MTKSKFRTFLISVSLAVCAVCLSVGIAACSGGEKESKNAGVYNVGEEGIYYYDAGSSEYLLTLQSGVYMISVGGSASSSGTYSCDEEAGTITFTPYDGDAFTASLSDGAMKLDIGTAYTFLKKIDYKVTFMSGSETVDSQSVTYGKAAKIVDGEKDGYIFLGWYEDAAFTTKYSFDMAVTGDVTLYAYYIEEDASIPNYKVEFVSGGDVIYTTMTQNGVVYDFPETEVAGWWVSATNNEDELTYEYNGETLTESTKLFAVESYILGASVYADGLKWNTAVATATITVDGEPLTATATGTSYDYDFSGLSAGRHEISITAAGTTENLVYVSKALSRVSNFSVYGTTLVYNRVENAQYYCVSVECANPSHEHTMVYNGNTLTYDFSDCEMGPEGINFTVYAYALGYETSVSEVFVYALILNGTTVAIDEATDTALWTPVANATGYEVYVDGKLAMTTTDTEYSFKNEAQGAEIEIAVKPIAPEYYSEISETAKYTKNTLKAPEITSVSGYEISWEEIDGAIAYELNINGYLVTVEPRDGESEAPTTYVISDTALGYIFYDARNAISVTAIAKDPSENSQQGEITYVTDAVMGSALSYADGVITWDYALAANSYTIELDGAVVDTVSGTNTYDITFTHSGENEIKVYFDESSFACLTVYTYAIIFDVRELAKDTVETIYVAKGDTVTLPTPTPLDSVTNFGGWYTLPDEYDKETFEYTGDGVEFVSGTSFDGNGTLILYAFWVRSWAQVTLDTGVAGRIDSSTVRIAINSTDYTLPVPELTDTTRVFMGWYSQPNGLGIPYTDYTGVAKNMITGNGARTFYAYYGEAVKLSVTTYEGQTVLEAKKGDDIQYVKDGVVTVPATYEMNGKEYTVAVLNASAFGSCKYIYTVNIPDTMLYVSSVNNGYTSSSGAFAQSANIEAVNVYATGDEPVTTKEVRYYSEDGVLFYKSTLTDEVELLYYPQGKTTANYTVPEYVFNEYEYQLKAGSSSDTERVYRAVTTIDTKVFSAHPSITTVTIPATVTAIESQAFYNCKKLTTVTMLATVSSAEVSAATTLKVAGDAFKSCTALTSVTLASRLEADSFSYEMFSGCTKLTDVYVNATGNSSVDNYTSADGLLLDASGKVLVYYPAGRDEFTLTNTAVTEIGAYAVYGNTNLKAVEIPAQIQKIGAYAFKNCTSLTSLTFASQDDSNANPLTICEQAFYGCTKLTELVLPQNCTKIEINAFGGCTKLTKVTFDAADGDAEFSYADGAFASTSGSVYVTTLEIGANAPAVDLASVFGYNLSSVTIDSGNKNYNGDVAGLIMNGDKTQILYAIAGYEGAIVIPGGVSKIQDNLFRGASITSVTIPASVQEIGYRAFYNCKYLATVTFDGEREAESLVIGQYAFYGCTSLQALELPEGLTEIGDRAFYNCSALTKISLPASLREIGVVDAGEEEHGAYYVFYGCSKLSEFTIAEGSQYFAYEDGILYGIASADQDSANSASEGDIDENGYVKTDIFLALEGATGELTFSSTIEKIWYRAFYQNTKITKISFDGDKVNGSLVIGTEAFNGCTALSEVVLPNGLTTISDGLFTNCSALTKITIPNTVTSLANGVFKGTSIEEIVFAEGGEDALTFATGTSSTSVFNGTSVIRVTLPERLSSIPSYTFYKVTSLEYVYIPSTVTEIGTYAFNGCTALATVEFAVNAEGNESLTSALSSIANNSFIGSGITEINIPDSVSTISAGTTTSTGAFNGCTALKTVHIPSSLSLISAYTFYGCTALETVTGGGAVTEIGNYAFCNCSKLATYSVEGTYSSTNGIGTNAFQSCSELATFSVGENFELVKLGNYAFDGTAALTSMTLPDTLTSIGTYVFRNSGLTSVEIPATVTSIGNYAFQKCASLATVTFAVDGTSKQSALTSIGQYAFSETAISKIEFPETSATSGVLSVDLYAFSSCESLAEVYLSDSVTSLKYVFCDSNAITSVTVSDTNQNYKVADLNGTKLLESTDGTMLYGVFNIGSEGKLDLSETTITTIGEYALSKNSALTEVTIPYTVTSLLNNAFYNCANLTKVTFTALPSGTSAEEYALTFTAGSNSSTSDTANCGVFAFCSKLESVTLREGLTVLSAYTFNGCSALTALAVPDSVTQIGKCFLAGSKANAAGVKTVTFGTGSKLATLDADAFAYSEITSISLPAGVTSLADEVFWNCLSLESITFLSGCVTEIGTSSATNGAFKNCSALKSIDLTGCVTIGKQAFSGCSALENIYIPATVTNIYSTAFYQCTSLKSVVFEDGTGTVDITAGTSTSTGAFAGCTSLEKVVLSNRVTTVPAYAFYNCTKLGVLTYTGDANFDEETLGNDTYFAVIDDISIGNYAFYGSVFTEADVSKASSLGTYMFANNTKITKIVLPDGITEIPAGLFSGCTSVTEVAIPDTVTSIGASAFEKTAITTINIPAGVTTLGDSVFSECANLSEVKFATEGQLTSVGKQCFYKCSSLTSLDLTGLEKVTGNGSFQESGLTEVHITSLDFTTTSNQSYPFQDCKDLVEVELNPEMTYITLEMFMGCSSLSKIYYTGYTDDGYAENENVLPKTLTTFSYSSFQGCSSLTNITIPGVAKIGASTSTTYATFGECTSLESVTIEDGVQEIGSYCFYGCTSLTEVTIPYTVTLIGYAAFAGCTNLEKVAFEDVPADATGDYSLTIANNNSAATGAFYECTSLCDISLPERTTRIGSYTFYGCTALESIFIPASVETLKAKDASSENTYWYTFCGCTSLTEVVFGAGSPITAISYYAFQNCESLESVNLPSGLTELGQYVFQGCTSLTSIDIPSTVTNIGQYAFSGSGLEEVSISSKVTTIGTRAFELCHSLESIDVDPANSTFRSVGGALVNSSDVIVCLPAGYEGEYVVEDGLKVTTTYAFYGCEKLTRVVLSETCETLASNLFDSCTGLKEILITTGTTTVNSGSFNGCSALESVYYTGTAEEWDENVSVTSTSNSYFTAAAMYWYSEAEPGLNEEETAYDGNFWYYDDAGNIAVWVYEDKN